MKKLIILAAGILLLTGCKKQDTKQIDILLIQQRDSLNRIIAQKDTELNDIMATMNAIDDGFKAINAAQDRVSVVRNGEGANQAEIIREEMEQLQETMRQNRELINKLRGQLRQSSFKGEELRRTVENLASQMEEKDSQLRQLRAELESKNVRIDELDKQVEQLQAGVNSLREETAQQSQTITSQDKQLNTAWFAYGTKRELKNQHIYENGRVLQKNFNREYFTKIDIRIDKEIQLYSRYAKLLTSHPAASYTLEQDARKQYVLRIQNPQLFWSTSKYLVVLVK